MIATKKPNLLTKEQEYELIGRSQSGDRKALSVLVQSNQGLIHKVVQKFPLKNAQVTYDDLWQQGSLGFIHAVEMFEMDRGLRLSTYSYRWIAAYIRRYYQNQGRVVRLPAHLADRKYQLDREVNNLTHKLGRVPSQDEIEELVPGYSKLVDTFSHVVSLNKKLESGEEIMDLQTDERSTDDVLQVGSLLVILKDNVSDRDYNIFISRYGVDGQREHSLAEIAETYGISRARIHQVCNHCLRIIRELMD